MGVVLDMMHLIPGKRRRIVNLDQHITTPSGAISLDVTHAGLGPTPVVAPGEGLERSSPSLVEFGFADCAAVLKSLDILLAHNLTLPPLISLCTKLAPQCIARRLASNWMVSGVAIGIGRRVAALEAHLVRHQALRPVDKKVPIELDPATRFGVDFHHPPPHSVRIELGVDRPVERIRKVNSAAVATYLDHLRRTTQRPRPAGMRRL